MAQGIGIRYSENGVRALGIVRNGDAYDLTAIAAGAPDPDLQTFLNSAGFDLHDAKVAFGLAPGGFLSVTVPRESGMPDEQFIDHLRWEITRKMIDDPGNFRVDVAVVDAVGFAFAGRRDVIHSATGGLDVPVIIDVEPVALYNGGQAAGDVGNGSVMMVSLEAEGICSVVLQDGAIRSIESVAGGLDIGDPLVTGGYGSDTAENIAEAVWESVKRLTSRGRDKTRPIPERLVLSGAGAYAGSVAEKVEVKADITTVLSEPFGKIVDTGAVQSPLTEKETAFTACFGLALRALEE